jgi:hypothetical protein
MLDGGFHGTSSVNEVFLSFYFVSSTVVDLGIPRNSWKRVIFVSSTVVALKFLVSFLEGSW